MKTYGRHTQKVTKCGDNMDFVLNTEDSEKHMLVFQNYIKRNNATWKIDIISWLTQGPLLAMMPAPSMWSPFFFQSACK